MQHFRVKVFGRAAEGFELHQAIPVFHRWIQTNALPELLIDVADYSHVPGGPGVLLAGHDSHYGLDLRKNRLGLLYIRRTAQDGSTAGRLRSALAAARAACEKLVQEPEFAGKLSFDFDEIEISVNDRLLAPNIPESYQELADELGAVLDGYTFRHDGEPRDLLTVLAVRAH